MSKNKKTGLGRTIIKDRRKGKRNTNDGDAFRHTAELNDGYDWGRLNLQSVTEQSNLDDFLATAELAGTEFTAEKLNISFVNPKVGSGLPDDDERRKISAAQKDNRHCLRIPRRPPWDSNTSAEELQLRERDSFIEWRRQLAELQDVEGILLTPFEKNLEFWRQLWRVIERSDVVVQIVDARNPLLFRCEDLEKYVLEVDSNKLNMILVNKADLLTEKQRESWAKYFESIQLPAAFFSAKNEFGTAKNEPDDSTDDEDEENSEESGDDAPTATAALKTLSVDSPTSAGRLLSREELLSIFKTFHKGRKVQDGVTTIGLVGYPNVGKSSTINAILTHKKVSVSATPGKTKHFQTLFVDTDLCLCDCPGLVMPTFVSTKAELVVSGILPIDQMRDHVGPTNLVISHIPRHVLAETYGILIPKPLEGEELTRLPTAEEFLNAYGYMRGFMTQRGLPDNQRAARYVLKDYVNGKLSYCHAPPSCKQDDYHQFPPPTRGCSIANMTPLEAKIQKAPKVTAQDLDKAFFRENSTGVHYKESGVQQNSQVPSSKQSLNDKPWKRHNNRNKKEKLRRIYADLDS